MQKIPCCFFILLALALPTWLPAQPADIRTPGEFEPQDAVWLAWPAYDYEADLPMANMTAEIIRALEPHVPVKLLVWDEDMQATADSTLNAQAVPTGHLTYVIIPYDEPWLRDMGPVFVIADGSEKQMVDFNFNGWGNYTPEDAYPRIEEPVDRLIAEWMGIPNNMTRLVGEGGNREFNGQGVMLSIASTELQRNPNLPLEEIEAEFKRLFGVSKVIWLPHNLYDDSIASTAYPGPEGATAYGYGVAHTDELARFVGPNTILLAEVPEEEASLDTFAFANRQRLEENYEVLRQATNQDGEPFEIIRVPAAMTEYMQLTEEDYSHFISGDILHEDGTYGHEGPIWWVPAKSYSNFLITNGAVLVPQYWRPGRPLLEQEKDAEAVAVLEAVFPDREIITFSPNLALAVNAGGGGIHCITAQEPEAIVTSAAGSIQPAPSAGFSLGQNYPNPFRSSTRIRFVLPEAGFASLDIYNLAGQIVRTLAEQGLPAGQHGFGWDGKDEAGQKVTAGVYCYQLTAREASGAIAWRQVKRMVLME
ncbi:MAG: agmatine deiminase family protein [Lewinellaceae bacterium]|nr:agmatine deiminase family protein [Lewinellaceae bacterium]